MIEWTVLFLSLIIRRSEYQSKLNDLLLNINMETKEKSKRNRPDHDGKHRLAFDRAKKRILASESICGICGQPIDKTLKYPDPMSPSIDHIIPIDRGGHPSDISNLQLTHWKCNRMKANKLIFPAEAKHAREAVTDNSNRVLPLSMDWTTYKGSEPT